MSAYVPKILLCGDREDFFAEIGNRPVRIVGQLELFGKIEDTKFNFLDDGQFAINGKLYSLDQMRKILKGESVDLVIFQFLQGANLKVYNAIFGKFMYNGCPKSQLLTTLQFKNLPSESFYDSNSDFQLLSVLPNLDFENLLDYDGHFAKSQVLSYGDNKNFEIDGICSKNIFPLKKNIYRNIYQSHLECRLKHYDAILIEERTPSEFDKIFLRLDNSAEAVITFARYNSPLSKYIAETQNKFKSIATIRSFAGEWFILYRHKPPENFAMYVVAHKKMPAEITENLPEGYKVIHAGRALSKNLGYVGDNTGDNVSRLNPYINEITALYWIWKNTSNSIVGLSHYRRFFTLFEDIDFAVEKILTEEETKALLKNYDICLVPYNDALFEIENIMQECGAEQATFVSQILAKNIEKFQPEYLDAFEFVMNTQVFYRCNMFITRRNIFDAYCNWLFSFYLDSVNGALKLLPLDKAQGKPKRVMGYFAERMITVWALKNNLRVKELKIMQVPEL